MKRYLFILLFASLYAYPSEVPPGYFDSNAISSENIQTPTFNGWNSKAEKKIPTFVDPCYNLDGYSISSEETYCYNSRCEYWTSFISSCTILSLGLPYSFYQLLQNNAASAVISLSITGALTISGMACLPNLTTEILSCCKKRRTKVTEDTLS